MNPITVLSSCLLIVGLVVVSHAQGFAQDITGTWINANQDTKIVVYKGRRDTKKVRYNENPNQYYGRVVWSKTGQISNNKKILLRFSPHGNNTYKGGKALHVSNGKEYEAYLQLTENGDLKIRKYVDKSIVGTTEVWTRVSE